MNILRQIACRLKAVEMQCSQPSMDTSNRDWEGPVSSESARSGFALPNHLLAFILSLVGDQSAEKAAISRVCRKWREVVGMHYMWRSVDASHRPLSSLSAAAGSTVQLNSLWHGTETLVLADDDAAKAAELLLQLTRESCSSCSSINSSNKRGSGASDDCSPNSSYRCIGSTKSVSSESTHQVAGPLRWTLPHLRHLRVHRSMGGGYIRQSTPQDVLAAADSARDPCGLTSLHPSSRYPIISSKASSSGLLPLEELVLETEVGPELLLALRGKTPRLKTLIISRLSDKPSSSYQKRCQSAAAAVTGEMATEEQSVSALEALLLLLEELPPQQLAVFGFGKALEQSRGGSGAMGSSNNPCNNCSFLEGLRCLRARLQKRRSNGDKEEAIGDELCHLLATKHHESLRALWVSKGRNS
ncbi:hypothetical protein, conserved [Eimeria praecox]|uniref:F-box domain-containing protein n=1 Tax=Eimeria praecox TaxID=51316 RepID=U6G6Q2_9EIME|nr:hypothetical protein, conserved [Eimeria praecox]